MNVLDQILQYANQIKNQTGKYLNTHQLVGSVFVGIIEYLKGLVSGQIRQPAVDTFAQLSSTYPNPAPGWTVLVRNDKTIYQWNGAKWVNLETPVYPENLATKDELDSKADSTNAQGEKLVYSLNGRVTEIAQDGDILQNDGQYLFMDNGSVHIGGEAKDELVISPDEVNIDGYVALPTGGFSSNTAYKRTNLRPLPVGYKFAKVGSILFDGATPMAFYDSTGKWISSVLNTKGGDILTVTIPPNATQYALSKRIDTQIEGYVFHCTFFSAQSINNENAITLITKEGDKVESKVLNEFSKGSGLADIKLMPIRINNIDLAANSYHDVTLKMGNHLWSMSASLSFSTFGGVYIGKGRTIYQGGYFKITDKNIEVYDSLSSVVVESVEHGLTISSDLTIYVDQVYNSTTIRITSQTGNFSYVTQKLLGNYHPFIGAVSPTKVNSFNFDSSEDLSKAIYFIADSYGGGQKVDRMPGCMYLKLGIRSFMTTNMSGGAAAELYSLLETALTYGSPKFVIWGSGMNDGSFSTWKTVTEKAIALIKSKGATPILCTIPSIPSRSKAEINAYVRASGYRYIDFSLAVSDDKGKWFSGMLFTDNTHPTEKGAYALCMRALADLPELAKYNEGITQIEEDNSLDSFLVSTSKEGEIVDVTADIRSRKLEHRTINDSTGVIENAGARVISIINMYEIQKDSTINIYIPLPIEMSNQPAIHIYDSANVRIGTVAYNGTHKYTIVNSYGKVIKISFYCEVTASNTIPNFNIIDEITGKAPIIAERSISERSGKAILTNIDKLLYYKSETVETNRSKSIRDKIKTGITIGADGTLAASPSSKNEALQMLELKPNASYTLSGFKNTWTTQVDYAWLYSKDNTDALPSKKATRTFKYSDLVDGVLSFNTDSENTKLSMYTAYNSTSYPVFDSKDTLVLTEIAEGNYTIITESGAVIPIGGSSESNTIEVNTLQSESNVNSSFSIQPVDVLKLDRDKIFKVVESGKYSNVPNELKTIKNGLSVSKASNEISKNELKENDIYLSYTNGWTKISRTKKPNDILDVTKTSVNAAWCWFGSPNFLYRDGKTFIGIVDGSNGKSSVVQYTHATKELITVTLSTVSQKDDHNQPSFIHLANGKILTTYCEHSRSAIFRYRVSKNVNDASEWEAEKTVTTAAICTYSHLFKLADGTIINIYRSRVGGTAWAYRKFNETTLTFGDEVVFLTTTNAGYMIPAQDDLNKNIIHITCTNYHPMVATGNQEVNVYYFKFDVSTNKVYKSDDSAIISFPVNAPALAPQGTGVIDTISTGSVSNDNQWIEDIVVRYGKARVLFTIYPKSTTVNASVKHLMYSQVDDSGKWTKPIMICRPLDGYVEHRTNVAERFYSVAATFDNSDLNVIWCPIQVNGVMEIFKIDISSGFEFKQCTYNSQHNQWRPIVTDATDGNKIVAWLDSYNYIYFENQWDQNLVIATEK